MQEKDKEIDKDVNGTLYKSNRIQKTDLKKESQIAPFKVKLPLKLFVFACSVVSLSWFFEGHRRFQQALTMDAIAYLAVGVFLTLALVVVQAFFIYAEEKAKGNRTRTIKPFDKMYETLTKRQAKINVNEIGRQD